MCRRTLCTLFATLALFAGTTWAQSQIRIVRLSYVEGDVQLDRDGQGFSKAFLNLPIVQGARLSTGTDGYAEAELEDGSAVRLTPNSLVEFPELERDNTGTQTTVALKQGQVYFTWKQNHDDVLRARVGDQLFTAKKKSHFRLSATDSDSAIAVFDGKLEMFRSNGQRITVQKNETLSLSFDDMDRYFLTRAVSQDPFDEWDHDRGSDLEKEQQMQANSYANLNQYGSYMTVPDYGSVWRPTGVGYDWNPYQDGSWAWYPSGYVWVSSYPWGWAPYRYGSWLYVNNVGWCWRPAPFGPTWNTGPVIVHPPGGFFPPRPPRQRNDGVIVVGRPPNDFDGDRRWHRPPPVAVAPMHNTGPVANTSPVADPRPGRPSRDAEPKAGNSAEPAVHRGGDARPERPVSSAPSTSATPPPVAITPAQPRPERSERLPSPSPAPDTRARSYTPPPQSAPAPNQGAPHYNPPPPSTPPVQAQPAPRSEPAESRVPKDPKR